MHVERCKLQNIQDTMTQPGVIAEFKAWQPSPTHCRATLEPDPRKAISLSNATNICLHVSDPSEVSAQSSASAERILIFVYSSRCSPHTAGPPLYLQSTEINSWWKQPEQTIHNLKRRISSGRIHTLFGKDRTMQNYQVAPASRRKSRHITIT